MYAKMTVLNILLFLFIDCPYKHLYEGGPVTERLSGTESATQLLGNQLTGVCVLRIFISINKRRFINLNISINLGNFYFEDYLTSELQTAQILAVKKPQELRTTSSEGANQSGGVSRNAMISLNLC